MDAVMPRSIRIRLPSISTSMQLPVEPLAIGSILSIHAASLSIVKLLCVLHSAGSGSVASASSQETKILIKHVEEHIAGAYRKHRIRFPDRRKGEVFPCGCQHQDRYYFVQRAE